MWLERTSLSGLLLLLSAGSTAAATTCSLTSRVVVAGGGLTQILYALGLESHIVGVDTTSTRPRAALSQPQVGYLRSLAPERILALSPTLVLTTSEAGPPAVLQLLESAGVAVREFGVPRTVEGLMRNIRGLATLFGQESQGRMLIDKITKSLRSAQKEVVHYTGQPRVLFVLAADSQILACGHDTVADTLIRLAGGINAADYCGYKPLTPQLAMQLAPQVILTVNQVVDEAGGQDAFVQRPELSCTPAGRHKNLVVMEPDRLLSLGPGLGRTVAELARCCHRQ